MYYLHRAGTDVAHKTAEAEPNASDCREERGLAVTSSARQEVRIASREDWQAMPSPASFQGSPRARTSKQMRMVRRIAWNLLPPLTFVAIVVLWWGAVKLFNIPAYLLPGPGPVFARLVTDAGLLWTHSQVTLIEILLGFGLTIVTAIPADVQTVAFDLNSVYVRPSGVPSHPVGPFPGNPAAPSNRDRLLVLSDRFRPLLMIVSQVPLHHGCIRAR